MNLKTLCEALSQNCEYFLKIRCGFEYEEREKNQLMTDDPEKISSLDLSNLLRALWNMHIDGIDKEQWQIPVQRVRILPVNGQQFLDNAVSLIEELEAALENAGISPEFLKEETAQECTLPLTIQTPENQSHAVTLSGRIVLPEKWQTASLRTVLRFSSFNAEKLLLFYLEHLLISAVYEKNITSLIFFATRKNQSIILYKN